MKCSHCGEYLGEISAEADEYDLMQKHVESCVSRLAQDYRSAKDAEDIFDPE